MASETITKKTLANPKIRLDIAVMEFRKALSSIKSYEEEKKVKYTLKISKKLYKGSQS